MIIIILKEIMKIIMILIKREVIKTIIKLKKIK
jgi:hypothetical protein